MTGNETRPKAEETEGRWPASEIQTRLDAGCPDRERWEPMTRADN